MSEKIKTVSEFQGFVLEFLLIVVFAGLAYLLYSVGYRWGVLDAREVARWEARCTAADGVVVNDGCYDRSVIKATR